MEQDKGLARRDGSFINKLTKDLVIYGFLTFTELVSFLRYEQHNADSIPFGKDEIVDATVFMLAITGCLIKGLYDGGHTKEKVNKRKLKKD